MKHHLLKGKLSVKMSCGDAINSQYLTCMELSSLEFQPRVLSEGILFQIYVLKPLQSQKHLQMLSLKPLHRGHFCIRWLFAEKYLVI